MPEAFTDSRTEGIMTSVGKTFQYPIDKELEDCIAKNPSTNGEFQCVIKAYDQWDGELNRIYRELKSKLDSPGKEILKAAQLKWIEYRDKEFELVDNIYPKEVAGSMTRGFNAYRRVAVVKARVLELNHYLESVEKINSEDILAQKIFEGSSERGDFQEALAEAIQKAKVQLRTDFVAWTLDKVNGINGGIVGTNTLTVTIIANSRSSEP